MPLRYRRRYGRRCASRSAPTSVFIFCHRVLRPAVYVDAASFATMPSSSNCTPAATALESCWRSGRHTCVHREAFAAD